MELLVHSVLILLISSRFEISCQLYPGPGGQLNEFTFPYEADNRLVPQLENSQPQSDYPYPYPYAYPPWPLYQHAGIPLPPQPISYYGGPPAFPYAAAPYPWYSPQLPYQSGIEPAPYFSVPQPQQPQELINLGSQSPSTPPCATILTTSNCILRVPDDGRHKDIQERSFVFAAGLIKDQCSLTVKDCSGSYFTTSNYLPPPNGQCTAALSVCCECYGCARGNLQLYENSCAILFENVKCSTCSGFRLEVAEGDTVSVMNPLVDDKVSSMYVLPECELNVYTRSDFQGEAAMAKGSFDDLPYEWNDEISSYKCSCNRKSTPPATTSGPTATQGTLYPIETTVQTTTPGIISAQPITSTAKSTSASQISSTSGLISKTSPTTEPPQEVITTTAKPEPEIITTPESIRTTTHEPVFTSTKKTLTTPPEVSSTPTITEQNTTPTPPTTAPRITTTTQPRVTSTLAPTQGSGSTLNPVPATDLPVY